MNKRIYSKVFHRAKNKIRNRTPLSTLESKVWEEMQDFFLRVSLPIIREIKEEEQAGSWINYTESFEFRQFANEM